MDIVFIRGLVIETIVGIHDWEKQSRRPVVLDLELGCDCAGAAATDRIEDALDYDTITRRLREHVSASRFELIETLAETCADLLLAEFPLPWLRLTLHKPGALGEGIDVGITIERAGSDRQRRARG